MTIKLRSLEEEFRRMGCPYKTMVESGEEPKDDEDEDGEDEVDEDEPPAPKKMPAEPEDTEECGEDEEECGEEGDDEAPAPEPTKESRRRRFESRKARRARLGLDEKRTKKALARPKRRRVESEGEKPVLLSGSDRLSSLMGDLTKLTESVGRVETPNKDKAQLLRIYGNVAQISEALRGRLYRRDPLRAEMDELAEDSLQIAEALVAGKVTVAKAQAAAKGYVKDLVEGVKQIQDELDEELSARKRPSRRSK